MPRTRIYLLTACAMLAFAANSLLCRLALRGGLIDPASFTAIRLISGAALLGLLLLTHRRKADGDWLSAFALFAYAAAFSFAYVALPAATGALLLFGAVQVSMLSFGLLRGEKLGGWRLLGFVLAAGGIVALLLPGLTRPPLLASLFMLVAGLAWGIYSLRGRAAVNPAAATAGNFLRAAPWGLALGLAWYLLAPHTAVQSLGFVYAVISGALTSGLGYVLWYAALRGLRATEAAAVQLSVPVLAAAGGILLLGEQASLRLLLCGLATLGGIALVIAQPSKGGA